MLLAGGMALFPFLFNLLPTCFYLFRWLQKLPSDLDDYRKVSELKRALIPRIRRAGAQGYSSFLYLGVVSLLQWSDLSSLFCCFHYLKRAEERCLQGTHTRTQKIKTFPLFSSNKHRCSKAIPIKS